MDPRIREIARKIGEDRGILVATKKIGVNAGTTHTLFHMIKWIRINPAIWITFISAKMHKNQPAITFNISSNLLIRNPFASLKNFLPVIDLSR